ncbi:MAG: DUF922 domain-containing protein [Candidatus Rifleibacteriota bacterium]
MKTFLLIISIFCFSEAILAQDAMVFEKIETYKISGINENSIRKSLDKNSPCKQKGKTFDAFTTWYVNWYFNWKLLDGKYSITDVNAQVEIKFVLPEWVESSKSPAGLVQKWNSYFRALKDHEDGHKKISIEAANAVIVAIKNVKPQSSSQNLENLANQSANRVLERYRMQEIEYDRTTQHGLKTGARFP